MRLSAPWLFSSLSGFVLLALSSCSGGDDDASPTGSETCSEGSLDCDCLEGSACDDGLVCEGGSCRAESSSGSGGESDGSGGESGDDGKSTGGDGGKSTGGETGGSSGDAVCTGTPTGSCDDPLCGTYPGCKVTEDSSCEGTASTCSSFDDQSDECRDHWGCGLGANGVCLQFSSSCSGADRSEECDDRSGCSWVDYNCVGTVVECPTLSSKSACDGDDACRWSESDVSYCNGMPRDCSEMDLVDCERQEGCSFTVGECSGSPNACDELSKDECALVPGCALASGAVRGANVPTGISESFPDLSVDIYWASRYTPDSAPKLQTRLRWINRGTSEAVAHRAQFYLSTDQELSDDDIEFYYQDLTGMGPYGQYFYDTGTLSFDMEELGAEYGAGSYYVAVKLDSDEEVSESEEKNNVQFSELLYVGPDVFDLEALDASVDAAAYDVGDAVELTLNVANHGTFEVSSVSIAYYLSSDEILDDEDTLLCEQDTVLDLGEDLTTTVNHSCLAPRARGEFYVIAAIDPDDLSSDVEPANNVSVSTSLVTLSAPSPDLTIVAIDSVPSALKWRDEIDLSAMVQNIGVDPAAINQVGFYLSADAVFDSSDLFICSAALTAPLEPTDSEILESTCELPSSAVGEYQVLAVADRQDIVYEGDETNNEAVASGTVTVSAPDFNLGAVGIEFVDPGTLSTGDTIDITMVIENEGVDAVPEYSVNVYVSTDTAISTDDEVFCFSDRPSLPGGNEVNFAIRCVTPTLDPGTYYLGFIADPTDELPETDESDNVAVTGGAQITIVAP